jgi:predicted phage terminase large subunit-like protein
MMTPDIVSDAILRRDFQSFLRRSLMTLNPAAPFLPNWHIDAIAYQLERVRRGEITRLIINMPPRNLKSLTISVAWPAYLLGHAPGNRIISISYGNELSTKHASDFRLIVESVWYKRAFRKMRLSRSVEGEAHTTEMGFRKSTSVSGVLTGLGGDIFIIDDPQKPEEAQSESLRDRLNSWVSTTLMSRLDRKDTGAIIVVMQRLHLHDLSGFLTSQSNDWTVLSLPAIAELDEQVAIGDGDFHFRAAGEALHPQHESLATLDKLKQTLGSDVFAAQYQQSPVPPGGAMIKRPWLRYYETLPERTYRTKIIQSWDTAAKNGAQNDYSVCTTWLVVDKNYYLLDVTRGRYEYPQLKAKALALATRYEPSIILIEDASTGTALAQELKDAHLGMGIILVPIERDKIGRLYVHQATFESGRVHFPKRAPFLAELEAELLTFPQAKHDDQVDSITQALDYQHSGYTLDHVS